MNPRWCDIWLTPERLTGIAERLTPEDEGWVPGDYSGAADAVVISRPWQAYMTLLVPDERPGQWQLWEAAWEGAYAFTSFAARITYRLGHPRAR